MRAVTISKKQKYSPAPVVPKPRWETVQTLQRDWWCVSNDLINICRQLFTLWSNICVKLDISLLPCISFDYIDFVVGLGYHAFFMAGIVVIQHYFDKRRAQANGIFMTGLSVGHFIIPGLLRVSIAAYAWQGALIIMAGVLLQCVVLGALMRPVKGNTPRLKRGGNIPDKGRSSSSAVSWIPIVMFMIGDAATQVGQRLVLYFTPVRCDMIGRTKAEAAWLLTVMGILGCVVRPVMGWVNDRPWVNKAIMYGVCAVVTGATSVVTTQLYDFPYLIAAIVVFGIVNSKW